MLDTKELRAVLARHGTSVLNEDEVLELLDRLEAAEKTNSDWLRANAPGGWIDALRLECDYLFARIEEMEKQEPVKIQHRVPFADSNGELVGYSVWIDGRGFDHWPHRSLYALPGAHGEAGKAINSETTT